MKKRQSWAFRALAVFLVHSQILVSVPGGGESRLLASEPMAAAEAATTAPDPQPEPTAAQPAPTPAPPPEVQVNRRPPRVDPPPAFPTFSANPTDAEITRARVFGDPLVPMGDTTPPENKALVAALNSFLRRTESDDTAALEGFLRAYPQSAWKASLLTELGVCYRRTGYFSKALTAWEQAWQLGKEQTEPKPKAIADKALAEFLDLSVFLGRYEVVESHFAQIQGRNVGGASAEKLFRAKEGASLLRHHHQDGAIPSGAMAVDRIMAYGKKDHRRHPKMADFHGTLEGATLEEVDKLASDVGLKMRMAYRTEERGIPVPSVVHLKVGHYSAIVKEEGGRYLIHDPILGDDNDIWLTRAALKEEASGYFIVPAGASRTGWRDVDQNERKQVRGKCGPVLGKAGDPAEIRDKGCDPRDPCCRPGGTGPEPGMAAYSFQRMLVGLRIDDSPVGYTPPRGPASHFNLAYNHRDVFQPAVFTYSNFGPKWTFDWLSYVEDDPTNPSASASVYVSGGGQETFSGYDAATQSYAPHLTTRAILVRTSASPIRYERQRPDGSLQVFSQADGATTFPRKIFMSQLKDPQGNAVTLTYDASLRLVSITDAIGQVTTISYENPSDPIKITKVTDPFGRSARFEYSATGQLVRITDVIGITSEFDYGTSDFITHLTTPYGTTTFATADFATPESVYFRRWLEATDPLGGKERLEYGWQTTGIPVTDPASVVPTGFSQHNYSLHSTNSFYWDKRAMALHPGDYTKAHILHWLMTPAGNMVSGTKHSEKRPLENRVWYAYPSQAYENYQGTLTKPIKVARVLDDGASQIYRYEHNLKQNVTRVTDPVGRETVFEYDTNEIDLLRIKQKNGTNYDLLQTRTSNAQHLPLTVTDAAGQTTTRTYNSAGQILTVTTPQRAGITENRTTTYAYDASGYLLSITGPASGATAVFTYDGYGRARTVTDPDSYMVTYDYDALDRPTKITYPDGTYDETVYNWLDVAKQRDRLGRWTHMFYDPLRRQVSTRDPLGRTLTQAWCTCGSLDKLIDANGNATSWERDVQGRLTRETRADGLFWEATYETTTNRLKKLKDAKGQEAQYTYSVDYKIQQVTYHNAQVATPSVSFTYDAAYGRLATMIDGTGTTSYTYYGPGVLGAGQVASIDGPQANDTINYGYDERGRVVSKTLNGVTTTWAYDAQGRLTTLADPLGNFTYAYVGGTGRLNTLTYPNGQQTTYAYLPNTGDRRLQEIHHRVNAGGATLSKVTSGYNAVGSITQWTQQYGTATANAYDLGYDTVEQLVSGVYRTTDPTPVILKRYGFAYDPAGNRTTEQVDDAPMQSAFDSRNRLTSQQPGGALLFKGNVNEPGTVTVAGKPATVDSANKFQGTAPTGSGTTNVVVTATDPSGNVRTNTYQVSVSGSSKSFNYDANGSLTAEGTKTYEWDGANRLVRVLNGGVEVVRFVYDGQGRRSQKIAGGVTRTYLYDGEDIVEERLSTGTTIRYVHGLGIDRPLAKVEAGIPAYYLTNHLGSILQTTDGSAAVTLTRQYDLWGNLLEGSAATGHAFTGREWDPEIGLYYYRARYYDPAAGRFISGDPSGYGDGPNLYTYTRNSPSNAVDPTGRWAAGVGGGVGGAAAVPGAGAAGDAVCMGVFDDDMNIGFLCCADGGGVVLAGVES